MNLTLSINQKSSIEVGYEELADFISFFNDAPSSAEFYASLAAHPASRIRSAIASKTCLSVSVLEKLALDPSIEVVQRVSSNSTALKSFSAELFKSMISRDVSIALELAQCLLDVLDPIARDVIKRQLINHEDPSVRDALLMDSDWLEDID